MKKTLAILLAVMMLAVMLPVTAMAAELPEAVGGVITLTSGDYVLSGDYSGKTIKIAPGANVNITINGSADFGSVADKAAIWVEGGSCTISGGTLNAPGNQAVRVVGSTDVNDSNYSNVTIANDATVTGAYGVVIQRQGSSTVSSGVNVNVNGNVNATGYGISTNGYVTHENNCANITVGSTGSVTGDTLGIYAAGYANWDIDGSVSGDTGIYMKSGSVDATGATVTGTGAKNDPVANGNGGNPTGDAIVMDSHSGYAGNMSLTTGAGTNLSSTNGYALQVAEPTAGDSNAVTSVNLNGGSFNGADAAGSVALSSKFESAVADENNSANMAVTGGSYSDGGNSVSNYVPADKQLNANGTVTNKARPYYPEGVSPVYYVNPEEDPNYVPPTSNPSTGAADMTGTAVALAVVSVLGMVAISKK